MAAVVETENLTIEGPGERSLDVIRAEATRDLEISVGNLCNSFDQLQLEPALGFSVREGIQPGRELLYWKILAQMRRRLIEKRLDQCQKLRDATTEFITAANETIEIWKSGRHEQTQIIVTAEKVREAFSLISVGLNLTGQVGQLPNWFSGERHDQWGKSLINIQSCSQKAVDAYTLFTASFNSLFNSFFQ